MSCITYLELDIDYLGLQLPEVGFLVIKGSMEFKEHHWNTNVPRIVGCNLLRL